MSCQRWSVAAFWLMISGAFVSGVWSSVVVLLTSEAYWCVCVHVGSGTCSIDLVASVCFIEYLCVVRLVVVCVALQSARVVRVYLSACCRATRVGDADWRVCMLQCNLHGTNVVHWNSVQSAWALRFWSVSGLHCSWCYGSGLLARCHALSTRRALRVLRSSRGCVISCTVRSCCGRGQDAICGEVGRCVARYRR